MSARRGQRFIHRSILQPGYQPGPGEKYKDGPKAEMIVTHVTSTRVWYGYALFESSHFTMERGKFEERYPAEERIPQ